MATISIKASDGSGSFNALVVEPKAKPAGVVVLIQEIFGVNDAMRAAAAWVADLYQPSLIRTHRPNRAGRGR
jgi:carboxymethylenebutenolidase